MIDKSHWLSKLLLVAAVPALAIAVMTYLPAVVAAAAPDASGSPVARAPLAPPAPPAPAAPAPAPPAPPRHHDDDEELEETAWLGVTLTEIDEEGARVSGVAEDSPAEEAGLKKGDRITRIEGRKVVSSRDVVRAVRNASPGDRISIEVLRDGDEKTINVTLAGRRVRDRQRFRFVVPEPPDVGEPGGEDFDIEMHRLPGGREFTFIGPSRTWLGVEAHPMSGDLREALKAPRDRGVLVNRVVEDSPAEAAGMRAGDIIISVGGEDVEEIGDIGRALREKDDGEKVDVRIIRDGSERTLEVSVAHRPGARGRRSWYGVEGLPEEDRAEIEESVREATRSAREAMRKAHEEMRLHRDQMREQNEEMREQIHRQMQELREQLRHNPARVISTSSVYDI